MKKTAKLILMISTLSVGAFAFAEILMKPGLWEISVVLSPERLAALPKDVNVTGLDGNIIMARHVCVTPEQAQSLEMFNDIGEESCKITDSNTANGTLTVSFVCDGPDKIGSGRATTIFTDNGNFSAVMEFTGTVYAENVTQNDHTTGKWLDADCG